jgi:hypothetical protein
MGLLVTRGSARSTGVSASPIFDLSSLPDAADSEFSLGCREIFVRPHQLVYPLTGYSQDFGYLGCAHKVLHHTL